MSFIKELFEFLILRKKLWLLPIFIALFFLGFFSPSRLTFLSNTWHKVALFIAEIISQVVMIFIFVFFFIPTGLIVKLFRVRLLFSSFDRRKSSYWIIRKNKNIDFTKQY